MAVDLKSPRATEVLERLVKWADVLVINFPHPVRKRLKLTYEDVSPWNSSLIYADITGYGDDGPEADLPGFDITAYWARSGLLALTRDAGAPPTLPHRKWWTMSEIITERSGSILRVQLNRPAKKNAMTSSMYTTLADLLNSTAKNDRIRVVLWHGAGDSFCAGNDVEDFVKNPPGPGESPQALLMNALINFDKPLVADVHGVAIGGGTTMLTHCDFVYAGESAKFQMPFINLGLVPEFGATCSVPARIGHIRAAELILLGLPFDAKRAAEPGLVTREVPDEKLLATATETAQKLAEKLAGALETCKRLMKGSSRKPIEQAMRVENEEFASRVRSADTKEAMTAFLEKRPPNCTGTKTAADTGIRAAVSSN
jgi:enoyl-CoA hydratase/carnithine racemase